MPDLAALPGLTLHNDEPVFAEPWQAQSFALTLALHESGLFSWEDWAAALSAELAKDPRDDGSRYWLHWQAALERLCEKQGATDQAAIERRETQWHEAAARTPHGEAIVLGNPA